MTEDFIIDQRLSNDGTIIGELSLTKIILVNNALFPWIILVPQRRNVKEIIDLCPEDRELLMKEICFISELMQDLFKPDKLNVAALGNIVEQLHIHIVARFKEDKAWPAPVFGTDKLNYNLDEYHGLIKKIQKIITR